MAGKSRRAEDARRALLRMLLAAVLLVAPCVPLCASAADTAPAKAMTVEVDHAAHIELPAPAATVFVANPDIADIQAPNATSVLVYGKKAGSTTVYAVSREGAVTSYAISVQRQVSEIAGMLAREVPNAHVDVKSAPNGLIVTGTAPTARDAAKLRAAAQQYLGDKESLVFDVGVEAATQVTLEVRVAQVSRQAEKQFGFNWNAILNNGRIAVGLLIGRTPTTAFGSFIPSPNNLDSLGFGYQNRTGQVNISSLIDALQTEGLVQVLAEPNLTAVSGETANFLAGGEFPVPVSQGLQQVTIEWKRFGVSIDFTPTVLDANRLDIKVRPEVSELTSVGAVVVNNIQIPGLAVRRADTTVELASGQSFAIAGLFQNNVTTNVQKFPWLGDLPILGTLFSSDSFQRNESELVIIVTPYIVKPAQHTSDLTLPTQGIVYSNDLEQLLLGRLTTAKAPAAPLGGSRPHLNGAAGFEWE